ncbi:MAG: hypothetical protein JST92_01245 [Deltaproteobacteria bacterium]|nr:hypothetical protein [Deltaproteobacteria bacterium]
MSLFVGTTAAFAALADPLVAREPFGKAHVQMMIRAEDKDGGSTMADLDVYAEGSRLRAQLKGKGKHQGELWIDGFAAEAVLLRGGKVFEPRKHTLEHSLTLAMSPSKDLGNSKNDRVAGKPCKVVTEELKGGLTMTRCIWKGLPLSVELTGKGVSFNAAAMLVEEGQVTVADLQPPPGAPAAAAGLTAGR